MKLTILSLIVLWLALIPTPARAWTYEQIESAGNWAWVEMEVMPTGSICVCYQDSMTGHVFLARRDSVWRRDDLGCWTGEVGHHLVRGPRSMPAVLLESDTVAIYTVLTDTGWIWDTVHLNFATGYTFLAFLAFDSSGCPALLYFYPDDPCALFTAYEQGGVWTADTIEIGYHDALWWHGPTCPSTFVLGTGNCFYNDRGHYVGYTMGSSSVYVDTGRTGAWNTIFVSGGRYAYGVSMAVGHLSEFAVCYNTGSGQRYSFYCNDERLETLPAGPGRVRIDTRSLRQIVYRLGVMKYAYRTSVWNIDTLPPEINAATSFDFAIDAEYIPLIAFNTPTGLFLASGDAVGIEENDPVRVAEPLVLPTIVRGLLQLPSSVVRLPSSDGSRITDAEQRFALLDISGRRVLDLKPGANDVSRLSPGVYFVHGEANRRAHKVVIER